MKINNQRDVMVKFGTLKVGDVAIVYGGDYYMKIKEIRNENGDCFNAVDLETGELDCVDINYDVEHIYAEFVIR